MKKLIASALLSAALLPACAANKGSDYFLNRVNDIGDSFRVAVKAGPGIGVQYEWTRMVGVGLLYEYKVWAAGWSNRELGYWNESIWYWGFLVCHYEETIHSGMSGRYVGSCGWEFGKEGGNIMQLNDQKNGLDMINARLNVMAAIVGADVDLRVGEWIDFVVGLAQFDPAGDDHAWSEMKRLEEEG